MVSWESKNDRGGRIPRRGRGQRGHRQSNPAPPRETTPPPKPTAQKPAPKGSPIAKKLARHTTQPLNNTTIPERAVQVGLSPPPLPAHTADPASLQIAFDMTPIRPHFGTAAPHRGLAVPRAGSSAYWGPVSLRSKRNAKHAGTSGP